MFAKLHHQPNALSAPQGSRGNVTQRRLDHDVAGVPAPKHIVRGIKGAGLRTGDIAKAVHPEGNLQAFVVAAGYFLDRPLKRAWLAGIQEVERFRGIPVSPVLALQSHMAYVMLEGGEFQTITAHGMQVGRVELKRLHVHCPHIVHLNLNAAVRGDRFFGARGQSPCEYSGGDRH